MYRKQKMAQHHMTEIRRRHAKRQRPVVTDEVEDATTTVPRAERPVATSIEEPEDVETTEVEEEEPETTRRGRQYSVHSIPTMLICFARPSPCRRNNFGNRRRRTNSSPGYSNYDNRQRGTSSHCGRTYYSSCRTRNYDHERIFDACCTCCSDNSKHTNDFFHSHDVNSFVQSFAIFIAGLVISPSSRISSRCKQRDFKI